MRFPLLYQINTRILINELTRDLGRPATLDDVPRTLLDSIAERGFEWVYLLGVWQTGEAGRAVSLTQIDSFRASLPDVTPADICGSPFAVAAYTAHLDFGGERALSGLRTRLKRRGLRLLLDFVPNHIAPDHEWVKAHPEWLIRGGEDDLDREPQNYARFDTDRGPMILAHGRDPYFPGWPDTVQLNYRHPECRLAMRDELTRIADRCDGVRCDMAMLVLPDIFTRTWGDKALPSGGTPPEDAPFWPDTIAATREGHPGFAFIAEVYWDLEYQLQRDGFDYTYDKRLYDRLETGAARPVRDHLRAAPSFQAHSVRFLENHDEPRAAATFDFDRHRAAAVVTYLVPGLRFFHEGQFEGRRAHVPMHVGRRPHERTDGNVARLYAALVEMLGRRETHDGDWRLWDPLPAWPGNDTWDQFVAFSWMEDTYRLLAAVNYGPARAQCYLRLDLPGFQGREIQLDDLVSPASYRRSGDELTERGLYLDVPAWHVHVFDVRVASPELVEEAAPQHDVQLDSELVGA